MRVVCEKLPEESSYKVDMLVDRAVPLTPEALSRFAQIIDESGIGSSKVKAVSELTEEELERLSEEARCALNFGQSVIVDAGQLENLLNALPAEEQSFSTDDINKALADASLISEGRTLKLGASAALVEDGRGAEVIENTALITRNKITRTLHMAQAAWTDESGALRLSPLPGKERIIVEHEFLVEECGLKNSNALAMEIEVGKEEVDLYPLIAKAAQEAGFEDYSLRCMVEGPLRATVSIAKTLPVKPIRAKEEFGGLSTTYQNKEVDSTLYIVGTRSVGTSRRSERLREIAGDPVYSAAGHYHVYSADGEIAGHLQALRPKPGSTIRVILEPARVAQVIDKK